MVVFTVKLRDFVDQASANRFLENGGLSDVQATGSKPFAIRISRSGNRTAAEEFLRKPDGHHLAHHDVAFIAVDDLAGNVWEGCDSIYEPKEQYRVMRGGGKG